MFKKEQQQICLLSSRLILTSNFVFIDKYTSHHFLTSLQLYYVICTSSLRITQTNLLDSFLTVPYHSQSIVKIKLFAHKTFNMSIHHYQRITTYTYKYIIAILINNLCIDLDIPSYQFKYCKYFLFSLSCYSFPQMVLLPVILKSSYFNKYLQCLI